MSTQQSIRIPQAESVKVAQGISPSGRAIQSGGQSASPSGPACVTVQASGSGPHASKNRCGFVLRRRYRLDVLTARSALGEHYQATDLVRRKTCSIKLARVDSGLAKLADDRLRHEAGILARLSHPNIVEARELNIDESGIAYLVLESLDGKSLAQHLENKGRLPLAEAMEILRGVCAALGRAHDVGMVHGDLRPGCIFLQRPPREASRAGEADVIGSERVKLIDFELACEQGSCGDDLEEVIPTYVLMGSFPYRAPEALTGDPRGLSLRSDIWSLAVIAYQMLTGRLPFASEDTRQLSEQISFVDPVPLTQHLTELPAAVSDAIMTALSKSRCMRFASVAEFLRALEGNPSKSEPPTYQKATGLFEVTPQLLAECRQMGASSGAVPIVVAEESSTRRYPCADYPQVLLEESSGPKSVEEKSELPAKLVQLSQHESGTGRMVILGLALLSILFGSMFAVGFVIAQKGSSQPRMFGQAECEGPETINEELAQQQESVKEEEGAMAKNEALAEAEPAPAESWVGVAPPPVVQSVIRPPAPQPSALPRPLPPTRHLALREVEVDVDTLPPPADTPTFPEPAKEETPRAELSPPVASVEGRREPMRIEIMD
jgi:serine/threonine protein kinase